MQDNELKLNPVISGLYASFGLFPHLIFLLVIFFFKMPAPLSFLIIMHIAAMLLGDYLLYNRLEINISFISWMKKAFSPREFYLWAYVAEVLFDGIFLLFAVKFCWNPLHYFMILLGCRFFAAPIQVYLSYVLLSKIQAFALAFGTSILLTLFLENPDTFLYCIILKGLLSNGIAVSRSQYDDEYFEDVDLKNKRFHEV